MPYSQRLALIQWMSRPDFICKFRFRSWLDWFPGRKPFNVYEVINGHHTMLTLNHKVTCGVSMPVHERVSAL